MGSDMHHIDDYQMALSTQASKVRAFRRALEVALREFEFLKESKLTSRDYTNIIVLIKHALND